jgi:hypothetical protein
MNEALFEKQTVSFYDVQDEDDSEEYFDSDWDY